MNRREILKQAAVACIVGMASEPTQAEVKTGAPPKTIASDLLRLANKIQESQMTKTDRDNLSEQIESLSSFVQTKYNTGALCTTDADCTKKFGGKI